MTSRGRWLALTAMIGLIVGMCRIQTTVSILSLSILLWMLWEWSLFWYLTRREWNRLRVVRTVQGRSEPTGILWAGRNIEVQLDIEGSSGSWMPERTFRDVIPEIIQLQNHDVSTPSNSNAKNAGSFRNRWKATFSDLLLHLPHLASGNQITAQPSDGRVTMRYSAKVLAAGEAVFPGLHVHFQDRLRFFRLHRFLPARQLFRILPNHIEFVEPSPLVKQINVMPQQGIHRQQRSGIGFELLELREYQPGDPPKSIAWKASARRDLLMTRQYESEIPVRVQLFIDGTASARVGGYGQRMLDQMTHIAATIAHSAVSMGDAVGCYLMDERGIQRTAAGLGNRAFQNQLQAMAKFLVNEPPPGTRLSKELMEAAFAACGERYPELIEPQINPPSITFWQWGWPEAKRHRNQLALVMAELYGLSPSEHVQMMLDDSLLATMLHRFLTECGMPWMAPMVSGSDLAFPPSSPRVQLMSQALTSAVSHARDNEVFVLFIELMHKATPIDDLVAAIKLARARHHRVAVICPSPTFRRPSMTHRAMLPNGVEELRLAAEHIQLKENASYLKRLLSRLRVPMTISGEQSAVPLVMSEISIARTGRLANQGALR